MKNRTDYFLQIVFLLTITIQGLAQDLQIEYFSNQWLTQEVPKSKAKFSRTIIANTDGTVTTEIKNLSNNLIIRSETYHDKEPYGVWKHQKGQRIVIIDYNFPLNYSEEKCIDSLPLNTLNYLHDNDSINYKAPVLKSGYYSISQFVDKNIIYPTRAMDEDIQGTVYVLFSITEQGIVDRVAVKQGVNIILDKEALRVIRQLKFSTPPTFKGQPISLSCILLPIQFRIE